MTMHEIGSTSVAADRLTTTAAFAPLPVLPEPRNMLLVLPKGEERMMHPYASRLGGSAAQATEAGLSWDDEGLTAVIDCTDTSVVAAQGSGRDNPDSWKDDGVELLLDPGHTHGIPVCLRLTAAGGVWTSRGAETGFRIEGLVARAVRTRRGWRGTFFVPWQGLGRPAPVECEVWGLNIKRIDQQDAFSFDTMQIACWHPVRTDAHEVMSCGQVAFVLPETVEDDARLAAMRDAVAAGHAKAVRAWTQPNANDVLALAKGTTLTVPRLGLIGSGVPARQATRVHLSRDDNGLDIRFDCEDADIVATNDGSDKIKLWKDDCVYAWLDVGHHHATGDDLIMVQVSAAGVVYATKNGDASWNPEGLLVETTRTPDGWSARIQLPWKSMSVDAPRDGEVWGLNLVRVDQPGKADFANMETSSLTVIPGGDMASVHRWGHLAFGEVGDVAQAPVHAALRAAADERITAVAAEVRAEQERLAIQKGLPANPNASEDVHKLLAWFARLPERKEKRFIIGQVCGEKHFDIQVEAIHKRSGQWPGMIHVSYADPVSVFDNEHDPGANESTNRVAKSYWQAGGLVHIHINPVNPWNGRHIFEPNPLEGRERIAELLQPGNDAHVAWIRKLDAYASNLAELRDAGVVVLWRPLHEMCFNSMYWYDAGATPDREVFKDLWRQMFGYLTYEKKLDNLVWVFGAGGGVGAVEMYPGPEYVDMVGISQYSPEVNIGNNEYEHLTALGKPFAFAEFGNWTGAKPGDSMDLILGVREKYPLATFSVHWGSWPGAPASLADSLNVEKLMKHPWVIHRDELDWRETQVDLAKSRSRTVHHKQFTCSTEK